VPKIRLGCHIIVKNEESRIEACLKDNIGFADYFSIAVDSGSSSDATYEICRNIVGPDSVFRDEWKDSFADSRNAALNHLVLNHPDVDYIYWIDSDDLWSPTSTDLSEIKKRIEEQQPFAVKNLYIYGEDKSSKTSGLQYHRNRLWKCVKTPEGKTVSTRYWVGPAHEVNVFYPEYQQPELIWDDWILTHLKASNESHRGGRTKRNIKALKRGIRDEPTNPRYLFYLAREYKDAREWDSSIEFYEKYIKVSFFPEEKYQALLDLAALYRVKNEVDTALKYAIEAWVLKPEIAEASVLIGELYTVKKDWKMARPWFSFAANAPHGNVLFDNLSSRTYVPHRWLSVASYYTDDMEQAAYSHKRARDIAPFDPIVRKNEVWMFDNQYPQVNNDILLQIELAEKISSYLECGDKIIALASGLMESSSVKECEHLFIHGPSLFVCYYKDNQFELIDEIDILEKEFICKMLWFTESSDFVFPIRVLVLDNKDNLYDNEIIESMLNSLVNGSFIIIDNFNTDEVKNIVSDILIKHNEINIAKTIDNTTVILSKFTAFSVVTGN
jgi:tetratricopeptide (TPR) repeat protein